jgi:transcriptional regulator with XRE-family HTH domain
MKGCEMMSYREQRIEAGITVTQAAAALGVSRTTINNWETGKKKPTADNIVKMSEVYGCTTDKLLKGE